MPFDSVVQKYFNQQIDFLNFVCSHFGILGVRTKLWTTCLEFNYSMYGIKAQQCEYRGQQIVPSTNLRHGWCGNSSFTMSVDWRSSQWLTTVFLVKLKSSKRHATCAALQHMWIVVQCHICCVSDMISRTPSSLLISRISMWLSPFWVGLVTHSC